MIVRHRPGGEKAEYTMAMSSVEYAALHAAVEMCKEIMTDPDENGKPLPFTRDEALVTFLLVSINMRMSHPQEVINEAKKASEPTMLGSDQAR